MRELSLKEWPRGLEEDALQLHLNPEEIAARANLTFHRGKDSLDEFLGTAVDLGRGKSLGFQRHVHSPTPGTTVLLREGSVEELKALVKLLRLQREEIIWMAPHLEQVLLSVFRKEGLVAEVTKIASDAVRTVT